MNTSDPNRSRGITRTDVLVVAVVLAVLAGLFLAWASRAQKRSFRINCIWELKGIGLAYQTWAGDHGDKLPMEISEKDGGTMEFKTGTNLFRHFQVISNELSVPHLVCPTEWLDVKKSATNFSSLDNSNISYFLGVDASQTNNEAMLAGDHNLTDDTPLNNGLLELTTNRPARWTKEMHDKAGNVLMADGSVQQLSISGVPMLIANTGLATNRLQMP